MANKGQKYSVYLTITLIRMISLLLTLNAAKLL